jgi:replicative DNA helicase
MRTAFARIPPQNLEAEMSVLGAMLIDRQAIGRVLEIIDGKAFYKEAHGRIFDCIVDLFDRNEPVDILTVTEELRKRGELESVGGPSYLMSLIDSVPTSANVEHYAMMVKEKAILRDLISSSTQIINECYDESEDVDKLLDKAQSMIFDIYMNRKERGYSTIREVLKTTFEGIERAYHRKGMVSGIPTGFRDIDILTSGFHPSEFVVIAGRTAMGKTSFALSIVRHIAVDLGYPIAILSLEMSKEQIVQRLLCAEARVEMSKLKAGFIGESDWPKLTLAAGRLAEAKIFIDDTPAMNILEIRAKARRLKAEHDVKMVVIDYLQLVHPRFRAETRQQEVSEISGAFKSLARELEIPVVAISQLSRAPDLRSDKRPQLSDLRESGAIEQDADLVLFVHRPEYYEQTPENEGIAEIIIGKQRNGPTGTVKLAFIKEYMRFENLTMRPVE